MIELENGAFQLEKSRGSNGYVIPLGDAAGILGTVGHILLTHGDTDHAGAALALVEATDAKLWLGRAEEDVLRRHTKSGTAFRRFLSLVSLPALPDAVSEPDGSPGFPEGIGAVATPGHTPGHFAFVWERTVFCGDAVKVQPDGSLRQFPRLLITDKPQALASTSVLEGLDVDWLCPGHGKVARRP